MRHPTEFQRKTLWNAATGLSILILGILLVGLIWLVGQLFGFLQPVLIPVIVAGIIAYVLDPMVQWLEKHGLSRLRAVLIVFCTMLAGITLLVAMVLPGIQRGHHSLKSWLASSKTISATQAADETSTEPKHLGPALARELDELREKNRHNPVGWLLAEVDDQGNEPPLPAAGDARKTDLETFANSRAGRWLYASKGAIFKTAREWASAGTSRVLGFLGLLLGLIMVPIYLFFFLKESAAIRAHWHDYVPLKASHFKSELVDTLQEINGYLISFFRGQVLVAGIDGILVGIALTIFGLPYGLIIGVFMAVLGVIPYVGNIICLIPACIIGWLHARGVEPFGLHPWAYVGCVVAIFVIVQQINSLVTAPKIVGDSVGLHPLTVIFSMLFWTLVLGGFVGALLAVPLTAAVKVLFRRFIWARQMQEQTADL